MMDKEQIKQAVNDMKALCDLKQLKYAPVSARSALRELGYDDGEQNEVLKAIYDSGFTYCFDHKFLSSAGLDTGEVEYPDPQVCYWGPDQLKSRLNSYWR